MRLSRDPLTVDLDFPAAVAGGSSRRPHLLVQRVVEGTCVLHQMTIDVSGYVDTCNSPAVMGKTQQFLDTLHAINALVELHAVRNGLPTGYDARSMRRMLDADPVYPTAHRLVTRLADNHQFHADPLRATQRAHWDELRRRAATLTSCLHGDAVTVTWPGQTGGAMTVQLRDWVRALIDEEAISVEEKLTVISNLSWVMEQAIRVAGQTPRVREAATSAREALEQGERSESVAGKVLAFLKAGRRGASYLNSARKLAIELCHVTAAFHLVRLANQTGSRVERLRSLAHHFSHFAALNDEDAATIRRVFDAVAARNRTGAGTSLTLDEAQELRGAFSVGDLGHRSFGRAMAVLNLFNFGCAVASFGDDMRADPDRSTLQQAAAWGTIVSDTSSAAENLMKVFNAEVSGASFLSASRRAASWQMEALGNLFSVSSAMGMLGAASSLLEGMAGIERGMEEHDDTQVVLGAVQIAVAILEVLSLAFPAIAPITVPVGIAVAAATYVRDAEIAARPFNLKFLGALCHQALELKGDGEGRGHEATIAHRLELRDALFELKNDVSVHVTQEIHWRPLCFDVNRQPDLGATQSLAGPSFAQTAEQRLREFLGRTAMGTGSIQRLLHGPA